MSAKCFSCGIAEQIADGRLWCVKYKFVITEGTAADKTDCYYFIEPQVEEGAALTAAQTLMLKESELAARHMRGPV